MLIALLALTAVMASDDPDGVVTTAPAGHQSVATDAQAPVATEVPAASSQEITPHGLTTAEQIDRWIGQRAEAPKPFSNTSDPYSASPWARPVDDRKVHGEVSAAIGTGDYSAYSARVSIPFGENGRIDLAYSQSKNSPWGYGYGYGYGGLYDPRFGPGYRGAWDPFFVGSGVVETTDYLSQPRREREKTPPVED